MPRHCVVDPLTALLAFAVTGDRRLEQVERKPEITPPTALPFQAEPPPNMLGVLCVGKRQ